MSSTATFQRAGAGEAAPQFDHERFDVYRVALEFQGLLPSFFPRRGFAALRNQLDRASASVLLNIAERSGRTSRLEKANFCLIARGALFDRLASLAEAR